MPLNNLMGLWWLGQDFNIESNNIWLDSGYIFEDKTEKGCYRLNTGYERERERSRMPNYFGWAIGGVGGGDDGMRDRERFGAPFCIYHVSDTSLTWDQRPWIGSWIYETGIQRKFHSGNVNLNQCIDVLVGVSSSTPLKIELAK